MKYMAMFFIAHKPIFVSYSYPFSDLSDSDRRVGGRGIDCSQNCLVNNHHTNTEGCISDFASF